MTRLRSVASLMFVAAILMSAPAAAQTAGVRAGVSIDPDQFYFGGHFETAPLLDAPVHFRPNIEIGLGNDVTLVALNIEFVYLVPLDDRWNLYAGGGPALNIINTDFGTNSEGGFNILAGVAHFGGLFAEFKIGLIDSPDVKFGVGYQIRWR